MRSIIDITDLSVTEITKLIEASLQILHDPQAYQNNAAGKILATLFYEPSTRTRLSFESAMYGIGGQVISVAAASNSSAVKGETISDTLQVVSNYADIVAIRHPNDGAALVAAQAASVPVINAGDGSHLHPTQTLADLLTIYRHFGRLSGLTIVCVGDLLYGRTVHSLLHALARYENNRFVLVSPDELRLPADLRNSLNQAGILVEETASLAQAIVHADVIYMTRVQQERFADKAEYERLKDSFRLDPKMMKNAPETAIVLHPLPRVNEIAKGLDQDPRAKYFEQTLNGKLIRTALIDFLLADAANDPQPNPRPELLDAVCLTNARAGADAPESLQSCVNKRCVSHIEREIEIWAKQPGNICVYCDGLLR
ncbi:aspartate carbamoyltransferase [Arcanobacterium hippocoleae]|uniref:Aspartate carbamoyltransferase n=1 Tax=Arcanobacterium hippocoleae TaxID=149017 RepID=A0ABU1T2R6_9ACTO|nr:aspartate carbamoyltransferase [Arcanobacterium hippocoleae]MDR6939166.1 aspartate carbamoyltransferase catalytic subunit [Arcanobacterium hippocoleae]